MEDQLSDVVSAKSKRAMAQMQNNAIAAPEVPNPTAARTEMDAPALDDHRAPGFDRSDVSISDGFSKKGYGPKVNGKYLFLILNVQEMK